jgi:PDZ-binding kinase
MAQVCNINMIIQLHRYSDYLYFFFLHIIPTYIFSGVSVFKINRKAPGADILNSPWAIKRLARHKIEDLAIAKRLEHEAEILRRLNHPNIVGFRGIQKQDDGRLCLAMEEGGVSLADLIEKRNEDGLGPFHSSLILRVAIDIARALCYLHDDHHMVHGDIKSQNILIKGNFDIAKLCDFGTSLPIEERGIVTGEYNCTEPWSPPEVHAIEMSEEGPPVTAKADIFSYGLVLWEMIALCTPHMQILDDEESFNEDEFFERIGTYNI